MASKKKSGGWGGGCFTRIFTGLLLLLLLAIALGPTIIANTSLKDRLVPMAAPGFKGKVSVESASFGWFTPVALRNVTVVDAEGEPLLSAEAIKCDRTLLSLLQNRSDIGVIGLEKPRVNLVIRPDGSNLEDALASLGSESEDEESAASSQVAMKLAVIEGAVTVTDTTSAAVWQVSDLTAAVDLPPNESFPIKAKLAGKVTPKADEEQPQTETARSGAFDLELNWENWQSDTGAGVLTLKSNNFPLEFGQVAATRLSANVAGSGTLTADCQYQWTDGGSGHTLTVTKASARNVQFAAPELLGQDLFRAEFIDANGGVSLAENRLSVNELKLNSDLGAIEAAGSLPMSGAENEAVLTALQQEDYKLKGSIDLAKLAKVLPTTMRLRSDVELQSGELAIDIDSHREPTSGMKQWTGTLETRNITAASNGQLIASKQPVSLTFVAHQSATGPVIDRLDCASSFMTATGSGSLKQGKLTAQANLDQLADELSKYVTLGEVQLAGRLTANAEWRLDGEHDFSAQARADIEQLAFDIPQSRPWHEEHLTINLAATGQSEQMKLSRLSTATLQVGAANNDSLKLILLEAVDNPQADATYPVSCELDGNLATWLPRVQPWLPLTDWNMSGALQLRASGIASKSRVRIEQASGIVLELKVKGPSLELDESRVEITANGEWTAPQNRITFPSLTLASSTISLRADKVDLLPSGEQAAMSGDIAFRADLARVMNAVSSNSKAPRTHQLFGLAQGQLTVRSQSGVTTASCNVSAADVAIARPKGSQASPAITPVSQAPAWEPIWREPKVSLEGQAQYAAGIDELSLTDLKLTSRLANINATGKLNQVSTLAIADLKGTAEYQSAELTALLRPYIGPSFAVREIGPRAFSIHGPLISEKASEDLALATLVPAELAGSADFGWQSATVEGWQIGPAALKSQLARGIVAVEPFEIPVSSGKLRGAPSVHLNHEPMLLVLPPGRVVEQVEITPQMCSQWLKYVAPLVADATSAQGRFSTDIESLTTPVLNPEQTSARGTLTIHSAQVGPGPLGQQMIVVANQVASIIKKRQVGGIRNVQVNLPQQTVGFQMVDGRVYHEGLTMMVDDVSIRTNGSVGMDQTLSLIAEIPIRDSWVANDKYLATLKGQTLQIPIRGTLSQPKVDQRIVENLGKQLLQNSAGQLIEQGLQRGIEKGLNGLFGN